ncbi:MAG: hypothetical protein EOM25_08025 [Deltaproteobacteria bacterium]|nr:hypothetical protein [Deltaproteobacteria bacterium]
MTASTTPHPHLTHLIQEFEFPLDGAVAVMDAFHRRMEAGLSGQTSSLRMLPSFLSRPRGTETGRYLALDLGGTNFRVLEVSLDGAGRADIVAASRFVVPEEVMRGPGRGLFDFLAECVAEFFGRHPGGRPDEQTLAFTFSFPVEQHSVSSGTLIAWTKGFTATDVAGRDVVALLSQALNRRGLAHIRVAALVNDTVGTLLAGAYAHPACDMGVILGTGTNACYPEARKRIATLLSVGQDGEMIVNMEWGNFDGLPGNRFDAMVDDASPNPGRQRMEKMVSAMYLGELGRLAVLDLARAGVLESGIQGVLDCPFSLSSKDLALLAQGGGPGSDRFGPLAESDRQALALTGRLILDRSARIAALAVASVLTWMDPALASAHVVAVDGALFEHNPSYRAEMVRTLGLVCGKGAENIDLVLVKDGSGLGSAIAGAVAVTA